jgi:transcriptional regulator with XRE-family HTH domain
VAIAMEIYEKIRYYREHTDFSQRNAAKILGISRNTVKKYWEGRTVSEHELQLVLPHRLNLESRLVAQIFFITTGSLFY